MTIKEVKVDNWQAPGAEWWAGVQERPSEPLIEATVSMKLSFTEYCRLLNAKGSQPGGDGIQRIYHHPGSL